MASVSRIAELASLIQVHTLKVDEYISSHGLPSPSFDASMPAQLRFPDSIEPSSTTVIEATSELQSLMLGPMGFLVHQIDSPVGDRSIPEPTVKRPADVLAQSQQPARH